MTNFYHIVNHKPAIHKEDMFIELEELAQTLVKSGLLRVNIDSKFNYAMFRVPSRSIKITFSRRQLLDPELLEATKYIIKSVLYSAGKPSAESAVIKEITKLKKEISLSPPIDFSTEIKIARLLVQSAHPVAILLILLERTEIFFTYSYQIGDTLLDVVSWQQAGENSGMQTTNGLHAAVYVSSGGNPFAEFQYPEGYPEHLKEEERTYGDGDPAIARTMVIAGQEIGHFADIMRDETGHHRSRYSATHWGDRAREHVRIGRIHDMKLVQSIIDKFTDSGMKRVMEKERHLKFFIKTKRNKLFILFNKLFYNFSRRSFVLKALPVAPLIIEKFYKSSYIASDCFQLLRDVSFNLAPQADVYKNKDKQIEEATSCIEAVARIPQQCNKWGDEIIRFCTPNLYKVYYSEVIPGSIKSYEQLSGRTFALYPDMLTKLPYYKIIFAKCRRWIKNKFKFIASQRRHHRHHEER